MDSKNIKKGLKPYNAKFSLYIKVDANNPDEAMIIGENLLRKLLSKNKTIQTSYSLQEAIFSMSDY